MSLATILDNPLLRSLLGAAIIFVVGFLFLRKQLMRLLILTVIAGVAIYFYYYYR